MIIIKNEKQIEGIRRSCKLSVDALNYVESLVKAGNSTELINVEAQKFIASRGGFPAPLGYKGYPKAVCTSINEVVCHGIPKETDVLRDGDIIKIDVSTILNGYYGDTCKTFKVGDVSPEAEALIQITMECLDIGVAQVKPDAQFGEIGREISKHAKSKGYGVVYNFTGHGVGLEFHEDPKVCHDDSSFDSRRMKPGMIFTIEPMINTKLAHAVIDENDQWTVRTIDGGLSAQFEHTVLVIKDGVEILTK
jgi:methionyl aminopeptidase